MIYNLVKWCEKALSGDVTSLLASATLVCQLYGCNYSIMKFDIPKKKTDIKLRQKQIMSKPITCHAKLLAKRESPYKRVKRIENKWRTAFCCAWLARILNLLEEWCCNFTLACSIYARWPTCGCTEKKLYFISGNESS